MTKADSRSGHIVLMVAHCAGMLDLVALPLWVGALISYYHFDAQQAGGMVTLFLFGAVASSLFFAPRLSRLNGRIAAALGFGLAMLSFIALSFTHDFVIMLLLHAIAGMSAGCALSFTHGSIGRSIQPHRLFATVGITIGIFALGFFIVTPPLVTQYGGPVLFRLFATVMAVATVASALAFPQSYTAIERLNNRVINANNQRSNLTKDRLDPRVWFMVFGVGCMALVQSMIFSFVERIGMDRGFGIAAVSGVLIALGIVNLLPAPLAVLLERRFSAYRVLLIGPILQAVIALAITQSTSFMPYAVATSVFAGLLIFTHTFAFGVLSKLDPSGRAAASTPAMLMIGAAIGPILGGTLVKNAGYGSLGIATVMIAILAVASFRRVTLSEDPKVALV
ncbi:putative MFS family arabinose efflux permease [Undibacterium sp. GrIS 1.8]|uniref:MFS transporter n=1 Tax=unclassified Undibacterium TaxID=2630295 RepID=UPI003396FB6A